MSNNGSSPYEVAPGPSDKKVATSGSTLFASSESGSASECEGNNSTEKEFAIQESSSNKGELKFKISSRRKSSSSSLEEACEKSGLSDDLSDEDDNLESQVWHRLRY